MTFRIRVTDPRFAPSNPKHAHTTEILRPASTDFRGLFGAAILGLDADARGVLAGARTCSVVDNTDGRFEFEVHDGDAERVWGLLVARFVGRGQVHMRVEFN